MTSTGFRGKSPHEGFLSSPITSHLRVQQSEDRRKRAGYLYNKPKVGSYYQAKVPRYQSPSESSDANKNEIEENQQPDRIDETQSILERIENWKGDRRSKEYRGKRY